MTKKTITLKNKKRYRISRKIFQIIKIIKKSMFRIINKEDNRLRDHKESRGLRNHKELKKLSKMITAALKKLTKNRIKEHEEHKMTDSIDL